jgi:hypothetical protein
MEGILTVVQTAVLMLQQQSLQEIFPAVAAVIHCRQDMASAVTTEELPLHTLILI